MTTIHYWEEAWREALCGIQVPSGPELPTVSVRPRDADCPACRQILDDQARGTVERTMRRRQEVQAAAKVANDVLWRRGYPLPVPCGHMKCAASVTVNRLTDVDDGPVTGYSADIRIQCANCGLRFLLGAAWPGGLSPGHPTTSLAGDEFRAPLEPMPAHMVARLYDSTDQIRRGIAYIEQH